MTRHGSAGQDGSEEIEWRARIAASEIEFGDLIQLTYLRTLEDEKRKALGDRIYPAAESAFKAAKRNESKGVIGDMRIVIFAAGCGVYITPARKVDFEVFEQLIDFDWSAAHALLDSTERLSRRSCELWPADLSSLEEPEEPSPASRVTGRFRAWLAHRRRTRNLRRVNRAVAERDAHCQRAYEIFTSIFSAVNMEKLNRARQSNPQVVSPQPSEAFLKRVAIIHPSVTEAEADFKRAAQRYARGRYGKGMVLGVGAIGLICAALASIFFIEHVPAFYGVAILGGGIGATVSVLQRMASGSLRLDYDAGDRTLVTLGAVRPLIGAIFGIVLFSAVEGGWLPAIHIATGSALAFYAVLGFLAGFNERFAQDMLGASAAQLGGKTSPGETDPRPEPAPLPAGSPSTAT
jgi:hypothetical protein